jgi:hypothetical protein
MKRVYFHGTSADHLPSILKHGLKTDCDKIWSPSCDEIYLWSGDRLAEVGDCEDENKHDYAKERAYDSAQMAILLTPGGKCVVLEIELDDSQVEDDDSCENMSGAVSTRNPIKRSQIKKIWISPDLNMVKGYFVAMAMGNNLFNSHLLDETSKQVGKVFAKSEFYFESGDFPLEEYTAKAKSLST